MKIIKWGVLGAVLLLFGSAIQSFAIEGLQLSLQCSNVVLTWPSVEGDVYVVRRRPDLNTNSTWTCLTNSLPATSGTTTTTFIDYGVVTNASCSDGGGSEATVVTGGGRIRSAAGALKLPGRSLGQSSFAAPTPPLPPGLAQAADGSLVTVALPAAQARSSAMTTDSAGTVPTPNGGSGSGGGSTNNTPPDGNFYEVVKVGVNLFGITNGQTLSGVLQVPVEVASLSGSLDTLCLNADDDVAVLNSIQNGPFSSPLRLNVDTTLMSNGAHVIYARASGSDTNGGLWEADSPPLTVTVFNEISFPNWMGEFGELGQSLLINATSAHANVPWYIDVYDSAFAYIGTFGGTTPDGEIYVVWDLVGPDGVAHTNDHQFHFYITTPYTDPPAPPTYKKTDPWPDVGDFVIASQHAFDGLIDHDLLYDEWDGMVAGAQRVAYCVPPPDQGTHPFAISYSGDGSQQPSEISEWGQFKQALYGPYSRNLIYFGHGTPNALGYNLSNTNLCVKASEIQTNLHTIPAGQTNRHAFRLVFLDGCSTATGTLPESFGIIHKENVSPDFYVDNSLRPSAFAGWDSVKYVGWLNGSGINYDHVNFILHIQTDMFLNSVGLQTAIIDAGNQPDVITVSTNEMKVFGYADLHFNQANR